MIAIIFLPHDSTTYHLVIIAKSHSCPVSSASQFENHTVITRSLVSYKEMAICIRAIIWKPKASLLHSRSRLKRERLYR